MTTIDKDNKLVTLINIFTVESAKQQQLIDLLIHATETSMRHLPGFISANTHRSLDGTKVANYAQWRSVEDFQAMQKNPAAKPHMEQAAALAKFEPDLYEVVDTQSGAKRLTRRCSEPRAALRSTFRVPAIHFGCVARFTALAVADLVSR